MEQPHINLSHEYRIKVIDKWDEIVQETIKSGAMSVKGQPLTAAYVWKRDNGKPFAITLIYRPVNDVTSHRHTTWVHIPLDGTFRLMPTTSQHRLFSKLVEQKKGIVETHWVMFDRWIRVTDCAYSL
jgi:hypothetical protein